MFNKDTSMGGQHLQETTIAMGVKVEGDFTSEGDVVIEGEVAGSVKTKAHLRVGEQAVIRANVQAENAIIAGHIEGNLTVKDRLELMENSVVHGDIKTKILSIAPGAEVNGLLTMSGKSTKEIDEISDSEEE